MGIIKRIRTFVRSNLDEILDWADDPVKRLDQLIIDMRLSYTDAKEEVKAAIIEFRKIQNEADANRGAGEEWGEKALVALDSGREDLAKEALRRKRNCDRLAETLDGEADAQARDVEDLKAQLLALKAKLDEARAKKKALAAASMVRKRRAKTGKSTGARLDVDLTPFDEFERMEEKIRDLEDEVFSTEELDREAEADEIENELNDLEKDDIEAELEELRRRARVSLEGGPKKPPEKGDGPPVAPARKKKVSSAKSTEAVKSGHRKASPGGAGKSKKIK